MHPLAYLFLFIGVPFVIALGYIFIRGSVSLRRSSPLPHRREGVCDAENPELLSVEGSPEHLVSCHLRTGKYQQYDPERYAPVGEG
jgi:hypothetical protein